MQFSVYLFDFDGTIVDSRASLVPVFKAGFASVGREVSEEEAERWMHLNLYESLRDSGVAESDYPTVIQATIDALDFPESIAMITLFPESLECLRRLHESGVKLGIVSNNTAAHIRLVLKTLHVDVPFDAIVGSDMFKNGKPHPEPIDTALAILGVDDRSKAVYVGDSLQDPLCGKNAGIAGVLVDRENKHPDYEGIRIHDLTGIR